MHLSRPIAATLDWLLISMFPDWSPLPRMSRQCHDTLPGYDMVKATGFASVHISSCSSVAQRSSFQRKPCRISGIKLLLKPLFPFAPTLLRFLDRELAVVMAAFV